MSAESIQVDWPTCTVEDCRGRQVAAQGRCLAHTTNDEREAIFAQVALGEPVYAATGVQFTEELLAGLLASLPRNNDGIPTLHDPDFRLAALPALDLQTAILVNAKFDGTSFQGEASFVEASFQGEVGFVEADFQRDVEFAGANFQDDAWFRDANFQGDANFDGTIFQSDAWLGGATFQGSVDFDQAVFHSDVGFVKASFWGDALFGEAGFQGDAEFAEASFQGDAWFREAMFHGAALFRGVNLQRGADFVEATFQGNARFVETTFQDAAVFIGAIFQADAKFATASFRGDAKFDGATFVQPIELGPAAVAGTLVLDGIESDQPVQLEIAAWRLSCRRTRFRAGGHLRIAWAEISLDDAEIPAPLIIAMHPPAQELSQRVGWLAEPDGTEGFPAPLPSLVSVQRADVAGLVLADIDLRDCHFAGAHHLDQLQLTTADAFHRAPGLLARPGQVGRRGRQVLAEECRWRQTQPGWRGRRWRHTTSELFQSSLLAGARRPELAELAVIYRRLRKGREDAKNEPGAADFYYGEMEMRRHAPSAPRAERLLLSLYWLSAGYALRASRALATLALLLTTVTVLLVLWGLPSSSTSPAASLNITGVPPAQRVAFSAPSTPAMPTGPLADRITSAGRIERAARTALGAVVFRDTGQQLTTPGRYIEMAGRLLGPVLLALTLLSIRNRVKR
jgi:uncharacterized protein YjbI with pentapeptide repeats